MSHHYSGPDYGFPHEDARLDLTDLYALQSPESPDKSILIMNVHPSGGAMKRITFLLLAVAMVAGVVASKTRAAGHADEQAAPLFGIKIFPDCRDWKLVSVAHEEGNLNDIRAILGNDIAIKAYREDKLPFPDGAVIARIAWKDVPSEENNKVFGRKQSFVAGPAPEWYLQFMVKDSKKYAATGGWGFAQFDKGGKAVDDAALRPCSPCHQQLQGHDFVFTHYAP